MTYEALESVELGQAEVLIEIVMDTGEEESVLKFEPSVAPYVEFE